MRIGLAAARFPKSVEDGVECVKRFLREARERGCGIVCFPEAYLPGMRGQGLAVAEHEQRRQERALEEVRDAARTYGVAVVLGMEWETELGLHLVAFVIDEHGELLGYQAKNQIPVEEEVFYVPDGKRRLFSVQGLTFGISICHEGWRYPETVRWAAARGAQLVFHPHFTSGPEGMDAFYEKAMVCRSMENTIWFASVNYALPDQESRTSLISPAGVCVARVPWGEEQLLVHDLDLSSSTRLLAKRYNVALYPE